MCAHSVSDGRVKGKRTGTVKGEKDDDIETKSTKESKERDRDSPLGPANLARFTVHKKRKTQTKGATLEVSHISYIYNIIQRHTVGHKLAHTLR